MRTFKRSCYYKRGVPVDFQCIHKWQLLAERIQWCYTCGTVKLGEGSKQHPFSKGPVKVPTQALPDAACYQHDRT